MKRRRKAAPEGPAPPPDAGGPRAAPRGGAGPVLGPLGPPSGFGNLSVQNFFWYFPGIFCETLFLHINETPKVILLKTALVRVSFIQIMQIRGKTTANVFGKVDTFRTYHTSLVRFATCDSF